MSFNVPPNVSQHQEFPTQHTSMQPQVATQALLVSTLPEHLDILPLSSSPKVLSQS
jgi:hypothetical protein